VREIHDAFGHVLLDFYRGSDAAMVIERDDGYVDVGCMPLYFSKPAEWHAAERTALRAARGHVLDVGAGAGRVSLYLQSRSLRVTAIDNSPLAAKVCTERGVKHVHVLPASRAAALGRGFGTIVMFGNNLGLLGSYTNGRRMLRMFHRMTTPTGRIIAQTLDPYATGDPAHSSYHRRNRRKGRMGGQIRLRCRYGTWCNRWFDYLFVSKLELAQIVEGTGWHVVQTIDAKKPIYLAVLEKD
jgi:SAM-dependent methyltransferase